MKSSLMTLIAAVGLLISANVLAADMPEVAKQNGCSGCHAVDHKVMGPAFAEVAKKYKSDAKAAEHLNTVIEKGSSGAWGSMAMPPMKSVSEKDRKELIAFILGLAK